MSAAARPVRVGGRAAGGAPLRIVKRRRRRAPRLWFAVLAGALVALLLLGLVTLQAMVSQDSFRIQRLTARTQQLQQRTEDLRLQVATLSAPDRIAREAQRLGLVLPSEVHAIEVPQRPGPPLPERSAP